MERRKALIIGYALIFIVVLMAYFVGYKISPRSTVEGQAVTDLSKPNMEQSAVLVWANEAAVTTLSFDFAEYRRQLQAASAYFLPDSWKQYLSALSKSGILDEIVQKKLVSSAVATASPMIIDQGVQDKRYYWKVAIPMLVSYANSSTTIEQKTLVTMTIVRSDRFIGKRGLGILSFSSAEEK